MKILLSLAALIALAASAQARLGETPDQIEARFGKGSHLVQGSGPDSALQEQEFKKQNVTIDVLFTDVSVGEDYAPDYALSEEQIKALLVANSQGHQWKERISGNPYSRMWMRDDGARAELFDGNRRFNFESKFLLDHEAAWHKAQLPDVHGF